MRWRKRLLVDSRLYLILDTDVCSYEKLFDVLKQSFRGGVDIVQLRDKSGTYKDILEFSEKVNQFLKGRIPFILNDRVDIASVVPCSGVHLGQEDIPVKLARKMIGRKVLIGVSCQTLVQVRKAVNEGADYIGFGSVFKTQTKPERHPMDLTLLSEVMHQCPVPVFAIGGIKEANIPQLQSVDVKRVAVCREICKASDVQERTRKLKTIVSRL